MPRSMINLFVYAAFIVATLGKTIVITVGGNTTSDATKVFQPSSVVAQKGDVVFFNFTLGNHTVTQSTFAFPCTPVHDTNATINGFDSSFRDAGNGTAITNLPVTVSDPNTTIWFFDWNTCSKGGVGAININQSSLETLDGGQRNAIRLNGTSTTSSSSPSGTNTVTTPTTTTTTTSNTNDATRCITYGATVVIPFLIAALSL